MAGYNYYNLCVWHVVIMVMVVSGSAQLAPDFYAQTCPNVFDIVETEVVNAAVGNPRMPASLVRLHFHDCFVNGCDGSVLLDNSPNIDSEKGAAGNARSANGFEVIDAIKVALEIACPQTVSCADILALASERSAVLAGAAPYEVLFGRRDSLTASRDDADFALPSPFLVYSDLVANFAAQGLNETDLIALSGAHTFGRARCEVIRRHMNQDQDVDPAFAQRLRKLCPNDRKFDFKLQNLDFSTPDKFDNNYFKQLQMHKGILRSDQVLQSTPGINVDLVNDYARNVDHFFALHAASSIKMGNISPLTGTDGEIRLNCRVVNSVSQPRFIATQ